MVPVLHARSLNLRDRQRPTLKCINGVNQVSLRPLGSHVAPREPDHLQASLPGATCGGGPIISRKQYRQSGLRQTVRSEILVRIEAQDLRKAGARAVDAAFDG